MGFILLYRKPSVAMSDPTPSTTTSTTSTALGDSLPQHEFLIDIPASLPPSKETELVALRDSVSAALDWAAKRAADTICRKIEVGELQKEDEKTQAAYRSLVSAFIFDIESPWLSQQLSDKVTGSVNIRKSAFTADWLEEMVPGAQQTTAVQDFIKRTAESTLANTDTTTARFWSVVRFVSYNSQLGTFSVVVRTGEIILSLTHYDTTTSAATGLLGLGGTNTTVEMIKVERDMKVKEYRFIQSAWENSPNSGSVPALDV